MRDRSRIRARVRPKTRRVQIRLVEIANVDAQGGGRDTAMSALIVPHMRQSTFMHVCYALLTALLAGCGGGSSPAVRAAERPAEPSRAAPSAAPAEHALKEEGSLKDDGRTSILVTNSSRETFCDGSKMDTDGYRKTLAKEERVQLPANDGTLAGRAKAVAIATGGLCSGALEHLHLDFTVRDGIVRIPPIPGWAGVGIAMCTCKPEVEVNLLRLPGISKVVWEGP